MGNVNDQGGVAQDDDLPPEIEDCTRYVRRAELISRNPKGGPFTEPTRVDPGLWSGAAHEVSAIIGVRWIKTKKSVAKRFKITARGKVLRTHAGKRHLLQTKNPKRRRRLGKRANVSPTDTYRVIQSLPFSH